jgi:hypothetical protein
MVDWLVDVIGVFQVAFKSAVKHSLRDAAARAMNFAQTLLSGCEGRCKVERWPGDDHFDHATPGACPDMEGFF